MLAEDGLEKCRIFSDGRRNHFYEIQETHKEAFMNLDKIRMSARKSRDFTVPAMSGAER